MSSTYNSYFSTTSTTTNPTSYDDDDDEKNSSFFSSSSSSSSSQSSSSSYNNSGTEYETESSSNITRIMNDKQKPKKKYCVIFLLIFISFIIFLIIINIIFISVLKRRKKNIQKEYVYKMVYYDLIEDEKFEGEIIKDKKVRGYSFVDGSGGGYFYPFSFGEKEEYEYKIQGKCSCCVECIENEGCKGDNVCVDNVCVECKNEIDCTSTSSNEELICNRGKCLNSDSCKSYDDCSNDEICNEVGQCIKGCRNDANCGKSEICKMNGKCLNGCRKDEVCNKVKGELCINFQCLADGCRNNFDCNDYDHACIDNQCVLISNAESCSTDNDCSIGYCDYEYFVCVNSERKTLSNSRRIDSTPSLCFLNGVVTTFVSTVEKSENIRDERHLLEGCVETCSGKYQSSYPKVEEIKRQKNDKTQEKLMISRCKGTCKWNKELNHEIVIAEAQVMCPTEPLLLEVTTTDENLVDTEDPQFLENGYEDYEDYDDGSGYGNGYEDDGHGVDHDSSSKDGPIGNPQVIAVFEKLLDEYCYNLLNSHVLYPTPSTIDKRYKGYKMCVSDVPTIKCEEILESEEE